MQAEGSFHLMLAVRGEKAPYIARYTRMELTFQKENRDSDMIIVKMI